jgi:hypothetical protein
MNRTDTENKSSLSPCCTNPRRFEQLNAPECINIPFDDVMTRSVREFRGSLHGYLCAGALGRLQLCAASLSNDSNLLVARNTAHSTPKHDSRSLTAMFEL